MPRKRATRRAGIAPGPGDDSMIAGPSRAEVMAAMDSLPKELTWEDVAPQLRPMFARRRPMPPG